MGRIVSMSLHEVPPSGPHVALNDGNRIPQLGFGLAIPPRYSVGTVLHGLKTGYRLIDTAAMYRTEVGVRQALERSGAERADIFITTKLLKHGRDAALRLFERSLERLGCDYVDLYLIHYPFPEQDRYIETWKTLTELKADGRARSIGVSNFRIDQLERIIDASGVVPAINQIGVHPRLQRVDLRRFHSQRGIVTEAYSPLGHGQAIREPTIRELAARHNRTSAQIVLRWHLQLGNVAIPRSVTPGRLEENLRIFDFELNEEDMRSLDNLDVERHLDRDPSTYAERDVRSGVIGAITDFAERHPSVDSLIIQNAMQAVSRVRSRLS
jgi:diketogulonate reductase-like aldo/keto reductase